MKIEIDFYCYKCGKGMCKYVDLNYKKEEIRIDINPCPDCLNEAREEGYKTGFNHGANSVRR